LRYYLNNNFMTEKIRITGVPPGQAPEWVRKEWVGLELPVQEDALNPNEGIQFGVKGGKPENLGGYPIHTSDAISALTKKSPRAAEWWKTNVPLELMPTLVFKREACQIIPDAPTNKP
jgi:hypothetical protein